MIIDARCRLTTPEAGSYFSRIAGNFGQPGVLSATVEDFFSDLGAVGITTAVSVSGNSPGGKIGRWNLPDRTTPNELMARLQKENWGRLIGVAGIDAGNTFHDALAEIDRCHKLGLRAIFIEPGRSPGCDLDDSRLYPIYEKCLELEMVLIPQTSGLLAGKSIDAANPKHLDKVAGDFPDLRILAGHGCYPYVREAIIVAARHENVYLSPDMYLLHMGTEDWVKEVNANRFGLQQKFLFGTSYPSGSRLKPYTDAFFKLPWEPAALPDILYKNALRLFRLDNDPTFQAMYKC